MQADREILQQQGVCYRTKGVAFFPYSAATARWARAVAPIADAAALAAQTDPEQAQWLRHRSTWYAGVNALPNDQDGRVLNADGDEIVPPLIGEVGQARQFAEQSLSLAWPLALDPAQLSICYPGYPRQDETESDANHKFRKHRDAAHIDGLRPVGEDRRRHLLERHAYILGIPLGEAHPAAAPLVVWEGSHHIMRDFFLDAFSGIDAEDWKHVDLTEGYQQARRKCFEQCKRIELPARLGESYVMHRHLLHGVAPWGEDAGSKGQRAIAYFRPEPVGQEADRWWLDAA